MAADDSLVKRGYTKVTFTKERIEELKKCMDPTSGPTYFIKNFMYIQHPTKGKMLLDPFDFQYGLIETYHEYRHSIALISRQMGKALALDTPIITPSGFVNLGDLNVGDIVYGKNGKPTTITYITDTMYDHDCYEIEFTHGDNVVADKEHLWTVYDSDVERTITTDELLKIHENIEDPLSLYIKHCESLQFETKEVSIKPYELGVSLGHCDSKESIPSEYIFNNEYTRISVLQGLLDACETHHLHRRDCILHSSRPLIDSIRLLLSTLGIKSTVKCKKTPHGEEYALYFNNISNLAANRSSSERIYISDIKKTNSVPVRCLQVDNNDHLFLCSNTLIPTHNTTIAAGYLLWYAMFNSDKNILIAAHKYSGASEIMQRVRYAYECVPDHIRAGVITYNKQSIEFDNGSRITATTTTENTGRGMSLSLVYLDEFAFVEPRMARELWTSLSPTLATGGKCIVTSTPNSEDDQFSELWHGSLDNLDEYGNGLDVGKNGFKPFFATWEDHPDRDEKWAKEEENKVGISRFKREHLCEFVTFEETLISTAIMSKMVGNEPKWKSGQVRWYSKPKANKMYAVGLDPCMGTGGDFAAIQVYELPSMNQVAEWQHNRTNIEGQVKMLKDICTEIYSYGEPDIYWSIETNTLGEAALVVIRDTGEERFPGTFLNEPLVRGRGKRRKGFLTTSKSKLESCAKLKTLIETNKIRIKSKNLISELKNFVVKGNSYEAKSGLSDDLVMSTVLVVRMIMVLSAWDDRVHNQITSSIVGDDEEYELPTPSLFL